MLVVKTLEYFLFCPPDFLQRSRPLDERLTAAVESGGESFDRRGDAQSKGRRRRPAWWQRIRGPTIKHFYMLLFRGLMTGNLLRELHPFFFNFFSILSFICCIFSMQFFVFISYYVFLYFIIGNFHRSITIILLFILTLRLYYFELSLFFMIDGCVCCSPFTPISCFTSNMSLCPSKLKALWMAYWKVLYK